MAVDPYLYGLYQQRQLQQYGDPLSNSYQDLYNRAYYNSEARYGDYLTGMTGRYDRNMDRINSLGAQEREDITRRSDQLLANQRADLVSRGMASTGQRRSIENRNMEDRNRALRQQSDNEVRQRIATDAQLSGDALGALERRNDVSPDMGQLAQLNQGLGASGMYSGNPYLGNMGPGSIPNSAGLPINIGGGMRPSVGGPVGVQNPYAVSPNAGKQFGDASTGPVSVGGGNALYNQGGAYRSSQPYTGPQYSRGVMGGAATTGPGSMPGQTAGGYPLPGGGMTTPTYLPNPGAGNPMRGNTGPGSMGGYYQPSPENSVDARITRNLNQQLDTDFRQGRRDMLDQQRQRVRDMHAQPTPTGGGGYVPLSAQRLNNPNFDSNGRLTQFNDFTGKMENPATVTMPGGFGGFYGAPPQMPSIDFQPQQYNSRYMGVRRKNKNRAPTTYGYGLSPAPTNPRSKYYGIA